MTKTGQKTIFCDIDGCLIEHQDYYTEDMKLLDGTLEKIKQWDRLGYNLILTTGRRESSRKVTEHELSRIGICYDMLIMGIGGGPRILINDFQTSSTQDNAKAINLLRNVGIGSVRV